MRLNVRQHFHVKTGTKAGFLYLVFAQKRLGSDIFQTISDSFWITFLKKNQFEPIYMSLSNALLTNMNGQNQLTSDQDRVF